MWPFSKSKDLGRRTAPVLPAEALEAGILAGKGAGVHMAVLYATMLGFEHEVLLEQEAIRQFLELAQSPPNFTEVGIEKAVQCVTRDADIMCSGPSFETFVYGPRNSENQHLKLLLEPYRKAVSEFGAAQVFAAASFDVGAFVIKTALERREADLSAIYGKLDEKQPFLAPLLMRARAKGLNKYGDVDYNEFFDELVSFLRTYFNEHNLRFFYNYLPLELCAQHVEAWLAETEESDAMPGNGIDFEHWCAARIQEQGWNVRVSKASGDQGIDIEAMRDGMLVAIQCKRYAKPIGNESVQQAYTGATHYHADKAVVIGTGGYTKAAIELAQNTGVVLIDAENIRAFTSLMTQS
jgi:Holliday junction resolvase